MEKMPENEVAGKERVIEAEERLVEKYPHAEELIKGLVAVLNASRRPEPAIPLNLAEITDVHE